MSIYRGKIVEKKDIKTFKDVLAWTIELREQMAENDRRWAESRKQLEEERKQYKAKEALEKIQREEERKYWEAKNHEVNKRIAEVTGTLGDAAEFEFVQAIDNNDKIVAGIHFDTIYPNVKRKREYDLILTNGEYVGLVEIKWQADTRDIHKLVTKQAPNFREEMSEYKNKKLILFVASHIYNQKVANYANQMGVCFLYEKGQKLKAQYIEPIPMF